MRILCDHGTPAPLQSFLTGHTVREAKAQGWDTFKNGDLLIAAEAAGFDVLVTTDKNIRHQQNLTGRTIGIIVLGNAQWPVLRMHVALVVVAAVAAATPGSFVEVDVPVD
jgi:predicted nuclease of predicted toxin-antitoxin system